MIFPNPLTGATLLFLLATETGAAAVPVQERAGAGCGIVRDFKGDTHTGKTIESGGLQRVYDVYLPPNYDEVCALQIQGELWERVLTVVVEHANSPNHLLPRRQRQFSQATRPRPLR